MEQRTLYVRLLGYAGPTLLSDVFVTNENGVRASLGDAAFMAAWDEGQAMTLEQAVAYALDDRAP